MELVYLGLTPAGRGKGFGNFLVSQAVHQTAAVGCTTLTLAVDSVNQPAIKLYFRHGFRRMGNRQAFMRVLRKG